MGVMRKDVKCVEDNARALREWCIFVEMKMISTMFLHFFLTRVRQSGGILVDFFCEVGWMSDRWMVDHDGGTLFIIFKVIGSLLGCPCPQIYLL